MKLGEVRKCWRETRIGTWKVVRACNQVRRELITGTQIIKLITQIQNDKITHKRQNYTGLWIEDEMEFYGRHQNQFNLEWHFGLSWAIAERLQIELNGLLEAVLCNVQPSLPSSRNQINKVDRCLARYSPRAEANNAIQCNTIRYNGLTWKYAIP